MPKAQGPLQFLPGGEVENLGLALREMKIHWDAEEGDSEAFLDAVLYELGHVLPEFVSILHTRIAHGDTSHRQWLLEEMEKWCVMPVPSLHHHAMTVSKFHRIFHWFKPSWWVWNPIPYTYRCKHCGHIDYVGP